MKETERDGVQLDKLEEKLLDMGFTREEVIYYRKLVAAGECSNPEKLRILLDKRKETLDKIHQLEEHITDMDMMRQEIRKNS